MRPIATDTHDFASLRNDGKIYVDKTMFMHRLVTNKDAKLFFASRPRRFGKSLTISAFKALFQENSYGRCLSFLLASCGFDFTMENTQSNGRADVVAKHPAEVCIFELKVDEPVDAAFKQLRAKGYGEPFKADTRPVWLIGLSFDSKTRHLVDFAVERF